MACKISILVAKTSWFPHQDKLKIIYKDDRFFPHFVSQQKIVQKMVLKKKIFHVEDDEKKNSEACPLATAWRED